MNQTIGALLVALLGAGIGAYFAVIKTRRERLWIDRYETLRDVVQSLGTIESAFAASHLGLLGVHSIGVEEHRKLAEQWPESMHALRQNMAKLRLLFKERVIAELRSAVEDVHSAFVDMHNGDQIDQPELHEAVARTASRACEAAIAVAQRYSVRTWF